MNQPDQCSIANPKTRQKKAPVVSAIICILAYAMQIFAQTPSAAKPTTKPSEVAAIDAYGKELDAFKNNKRNHALILGAEGDKPEVQKWKEFKSRRARGEAFNGILENVADVWMKNGKPVVAEFNFETNSGDWSQFVQYYFRDDGTLAKMRSTFAGFMVLSEHGGRIVQERIYSSNGKLLQKRLHCFELEKKDRPTKCSGDYSKYDGTYYRRAQDLGFYGLLKSGLSRK
jgi:hypothetical protein